MSLTNAKVGDVLLVERQHNAYLTKVDRTTTTLVFCGMMRFNRRGAQSPRMQWDYTRARIATEEDVAKVKEATHRQQCIKAIIDMCQNVNTLRKMTTEKLEQLARVLEDT